MATLGQRIISHAIINQQNVRENAELLDIKYGLLSVDKWKQQVSIILIDEINKLTLTKNNQKEIKSHIEAQLNILIDEVNTKIAEGNAKTIKGRLKQIFINIFINLKDVKKGIPQYADEIIRQMTKTQTQAEMKETVKVQLKEYLDKSFDTKSMEEINSILLRTHSSSIESAKIKLNDDISQMQRRIWKEALALIVLAILLFSSVAFYSRPSRSLKPIQSVSLITALLILLITGVATPMIVMEAKISKISFVLLEHTLQFDNQVLYFQSKSVLDVFWIMVKNEAIPMKLVGILMVTFSILFPLSKLLSAALYSFNFHNSKKNALINFFIFKSGKWSMADVLVVAIFMAYIGFNGILTSQLSKMNTQTKELGLLTTNGTNLQPGYYLFFTYALLALFLAGFLKRDGAPK